MDESAGGLGVLLMTQGHFVERKNMSSEDRTIDAILGSPPERDELIVQLFHRDGPLFGEIYREHGIYRIEFIDQSERPVLRLDADELVAVMQLSLRVLRSCITDQSDINQNNFPNSRSDHPSDP